ncbi:MAG: hypothetical protein IJD67_06385 [Clostridia bacterium]|nr:hypothetical protein [Clostridia bacterium]
MKEELISTVIGAAVIEFISAFVLPKSSGSLTKYLRYLLALVLVISIITPAVNIIRGNALSFTDALDEIRLKEEQSLNYKYVYIKDSVAYEADSGGEAISDKPVPCDMYILEVVRSIVKEIDKTLDERFGVRTELGVSLDISDMENINIISLRISGLEGYIKSDVKSYLEKELGCRVCVS